MRRRIHARVKLWLPLICAAAAAGIPAGCNRNANQGPHQAVAVTVQDPAISRVVGGAAYSANIQPYTQVSLAFQVNGYVHSITQVRGADGHMRDLQGGDIVKVGELMATVDENTYRQAVDNAQSELNAARAAYVLAKKTYDRYSSLIEQAVISRSEYDSAVQSYQSTSSQVQASQATLNRAQINLGYCKLASPIDGVILNRDVEIGSLVGPNVTAFQVADTRSMKAVFAAPDVLVSQLKTGSPLTLTTEAVPSVDFGGTITRISPNADPTTRVFDVEVTIPNDRGLLRTGMIASLKLGGAQAASELTVPISSVVRPPGQDHGYAVYVANGQGRNLAARLRVVELGDIIGNQIEVNGGLKPGDRVIVRGAGIVTDGQQIRIVPQ
jgi:RND family efflux transporter MFP subunit